MVYLWGVTVLWAFSFSLIGEYLSGNVDSWVAVSSRAFLALLVFLPFMLRQRTPGLLAVHLMLIGAVQLGVMYLCFYNAFAFISVAEVALFTVLTPVWITLLEDLLRRRFSLRYLLAALLAVLAAACMRLDAIDEQWLIGFVLIQAANLCFALGQVAYRRLVRSGALGELPQHAVFGWFFVGALLVSAFGTGIWGDFKQLPNSTSQWLVLLWLGIVASGIGYFAWNRAATRVGAGTLAVMNNALVPAAILVNFALWQQPLRIGNLLAGTTLLILALWVGESRKNHTSLSRC